MYDTNRSKRSDFKIGYYFCKHTPSQGCAYAIPLQIQPSPFLLHTSGLIHNQDFGKFTNTYKSHSSSEQTPVRCLETGYNTYQYKNWNIEIGYIKKVIYILDCSIFLL